MYFKGETVVDAHPPLGRLFVYFIAKYIRRSRASVEEYDSNVYIGKAYTNTIISGEYTALRTLSAVTSCVSVVVGHEILTEMGVPQDKAFFASLLLLFEGAMYSIFRLFMIDSYVLVSISIILLSLMKMNRLSCTLQRMHRRTKQKVHPTDQMEGTRAAAAKSAQGIDICTISIKKDNSKTKKIEDSNISCTDRKSREDSRKREGMKRKSPLRLYIQCMLWAAVLSVSLGIGASFKWAVLPMGVPIGVYLLADLIRSKRESAKKIKLLLPVLQGTLILSISFLIYMGVFVANFQVQNSFTSKTNFWYSLRYNAALKNSPYAAYKRVQIPRNGSVQIADLSMSQFITVNEKTLSVTKSADASTEWTVRPVETMEYNRPVHIQHNSGLYLSGEESSFLSEAPSVLQIEEAADGVGIKNKNGNYLYLSEREGGRWRDASHSLLLLCSHKKSSAPPEPNGHPIYSSAIRPSNYMEMFVESNKVIFKCNSTLNGNHKYKSHPSTWLYKLSPIHLWSGAVGETASKDKHEATSQMFFLPNPIILFLSFLSLFLYTGLILTTKLKNALAHVLLLSAYLSNYLPYFLLSRDTYAHHYIPSYYVSILVLGCILGKADSRNIFISTVFLAGAFFMGQLPVLTGGTPSYERCTGAFACTGASSVCEVFDSVFE
ncbi:hypothetical protein NEMIN01_0286 [Nematocida minor]|uniref:uncharacterized protein n=1 Tax=Nematocida minor TaxID=1912983 RepID=UPI00221EE88E|nr:uncharacterized protein NEMIN01_0286 [Nematocida minor]KAI5189120.1 hypothetical protein NEMIN01_0286 [Nematocida minor]